MVAPSKALSRSLSMTRLLPLLLLVVACATPNTSESSAQPQQAKAAVTEALAKLPACAAGAAVGQLVVAPHICTEKLCKAACCNGCTWKATFTTASGAQPVDRARVLEALHLPEQALDCEVAAWNEALTGQSLALDSTACVAR
jgi:hypothetical protein